MEGDEFKTTLKERVAIRLKNFAGNDKEQEKFEAMFNAVLDRVNGTIQSTKYAFKPVKGRKDMRVISFKHIPIDIAASIAHKKIHVTAHRNELRYTELALARTVGCDEAEVQDALDKLNDVRIEIEAMMMLDFNIAMESSVTSLAYKSIMDSKTEAAIAKLLFAYFIADNVAETKYSEFFRGESEVSCEDTDELEEGVHAELDKLITKVNVDLKHTDYAFKALPPTMHEYELKFKYIPISLLVRIVGEKLSCARIWNRDLFRDTILTGVNTQDLTAKITADLDKNYNIDSKPCTQELLDSHLHKRAGAIIVGHVRTLFNIENLMYGNYHAHF